jgi:type I restriction enzyme S subunit
MGDPPGDSALYPQGHPPGIITADCIRWRIEPALGSARYFVYAARTLGVRQQMLDITQGVAQKKVSLERFKTVRFPVAPLPEQHRIVAAIEDYFSRLDEAVALLERVLRNLKRYRASVLKAAVEGRLVPTEAELARAEGRTYEPANEVIFRTPMPPRPNRWNSRSKDIIPGHASLAVGNPETVVPEGWAWAPLVDIARMESGHTPSREHPEWWGGDVAWIGIADAREHDGRTIFKTFQQTNEDGLANSAARLLPAGTVCVSRTASVGYVVVMGRAMATSQDFVNWTPTPVVSSDWLRVVFSADREVLRRFGKGSVHKTIYFPEWLSVHVAVPPVSEQARIVAEVDRRLSVADRLEATAAAQILRTARLRQSILKWAFEGRLADQDPADEPAAVLLERIRAERAAHGATKPSGRRRKGTAPPSVTINAAADGGTNP